MSLSKHYIPCPSTLPPFLSWYLATFRNIVLLGGGSRSGNRARNASCTIVEFWVRAYSVTTKYSALYSTEASWTLMATHAFCRARTHEKQITATNTQSRYYVMSHLSGHFKREMDNSPFHNVLKCNWKLSLPEPINKLFLSPVPMNKRFAPGAFLLPKQHERKWILTDLK